MTGLVVAHSRAELHAARGALQGRVATVFTMGALHDGHQALLTRARDESDSLLATIFVNPTQFGPGEDLSRYPRPLDQDLARCEKAGVDVVWTPAVEDVYPVGMPLVRIAPGPLGAQLEGASRRPGHFAGVLSVVSKLLHLTGPDAAYFGEKDYQQLVLIARMVADLDFGVQVVGVPTVREPDGLALSSRNAYLDATARRAAAALHRALAESAGVLRSGHPAEDALAAGRAVLEAEPAIVTDYLALRADDLGAGADRVLVAARVGGTRLIDNLAVRW